jgi:hypothetical protein
MSAYVSPVVLLDARPSAAVCEKKGAEISPPKPYEALTNFLARPHSLMWCARQKISGRSASFFSPRFAQPANESLRFVCVSPSFAQNRRVIDQTFFRQFIFVHQNFMKFTSTTNALRVGYTAALSKFQGWLCIRCWF